MTDTPPYLVDVLICTYQRPEMLAKTLAGIKRAAEGVGQVRIIVVDNDVQQSAAHVTRRWAADADLPVTYLSQPLQNISLTRNMALENANAPWLALIDDDEVPDENWLRALLATAGQYEADAVFGPVISVFEPDAPAWATNGTLFQRKRFPTGSSVPPREARTGNVLLRAASLARNTFRFDPELGLSGGEDSEFFARLSSAGCKMIWCDDACVFEGTPSSRTRVAWVLKRGFRIGSVEAYNSRRFRQMRKTSLAALKSLVFMAEGSVLTLVWAPFSSARSVQGMRRAAMGAGFFYGLLGGPYSEYRAAASAEKTSG
jgi:glycosyltransferase involved in cell wall biosynthesis